MQLTTRALAIALSFVGASLAAGDAAAQGAGRRGMPRTGFEAFLAGPGQAVAGRTMRIRGRAYEVLGLADLRPLPRASIRARFGTTDREDASGPWRSFTGDAQGRFVAEVPVPAEALGSAEVEVVVAQGDRARSFIVPVEVVAPIELQGRTDRVLYEPGETVHVWVRAWDRESGRPAAGLPVAAVVHDDGVAPRRSLTTTAAGVASFSFVLPETAIEGARTIGLEIGEPGVPIEGHLSFRVGRRAVDRLTATIELSPASAAPEETVAARVEVRTPSGAPVSGALVRLTVGGTQELAAVETDPSGVAIVTFRVPAYLPSNSRRVTVEGAAAHPAHGSIGVSGELRVVMPTALVIDAVVPHQGLIPEMDDELILTVLDATGEPAPPGTEVEVRGAAVRGGSVRRTVDRHGFASIPTRTPAGAAAVHRGEGDECDGELSTSIDVAVLGAQARTARLCVPVLADVAVAPTVARPLVAPGDRIEVAVARRPEVARRPVVVDLIEWLGDTRVLVDTTILGPGDARAAFVAPADRVGRFAVLARPLLDERTCEGRGAYDSLLVVPAHPSFVTLETDQELYSVRGTAQVTVRTDPAGGPGWVALVARDLAMHAGERPFAYEFLGGAFDQAVLDPSTPEAELLIRAALAASAPLDAAPQVSQPITDAFGVERQRVYGLPEAPERGILRDPLFLADELRRRGVQDLMRGLERALADALDAGTLEELTEGRGASRRFRPGATEVVAGDAAGNPFRTLGDGEITVDMLTAADPSFTFTAVATRVARQRLVRLLAALARYLDPSQGGGARRRGGAAAEPPERWLSRMVQLGLLSPTDLHDPWGNTFVLRRTGRAPAVILAVEAAGIELLSSGPDGAPGTADDVRDPFARAVPAGTTYAVACREDALMRALAAIAPGEGALRALVAAYRRLSDSAIEESVGDRALAAASEEALTEALDAVGVADLETTGHGGGGSGSGYGRGAGSTRSHRTPTVLGPGSGGRGALSALLRERFPATLRFVPEAPLDPSGRTVIALPLADAITTYLVEAIVWTRAGWAWSGSARVRVDQDVVVDAPVPGDAVVGDRLRLPLRVAVRSETSQRVRLSATASGELGVTPVETGELLVPGAGAIEETVEFVLTRRGEGVITVAAQGTDGRAIDATQRPLRVVDDARRVRDEIEEVVGGRGALSIVVPAEALVRGEGQSVTLALGPAIARGQGSPDASWDAWVSVFAGRRLADAELARELAAAITAEHDQLARTELVARAIGVLWSDPATPDDVIDRGLNALARSMGARPPEPYELRLREAVVLLLLAPAAAAPDARPARREALVELVRRLRRRVEEASAMSSDTPWLWATQAAALLWSAREGVRRDRAMELVRRVRRATIEVGDDVWLEGGAGDEGDRPIDGTALLALCEARLGDRARAFRLVRTVARLATARGGHSPEARALDPLGRALAQAAAAEMTRGRPIGAVTVRIDGAAQRVELLDGVATVPAPALGRSGEHRVELEAPPEAVALLRLRAEYGLPWTVAPPPPDRGPLALALEGAPGAIDGRSGYALEVRNTSPRLLLAPVIEVDLPAGAELDERARRAIAQQTARPPDLLGRTLVLRLRPLCPGARARIELPLRWSVAGRLRGMGATGYAADRPRALSILPSREVVISDSGGQARPPQPQGGAR